MEIELQMRKDGILPKDIQDEITQARIVSGDEDAFDVEQYLQENDLYEYEPAVFNIKDVTFFNKHDARHTHILILDGAVSMLARIEYELFKRIKEAMTGMKTKTLEDFKIKTDEPK